MAESPSLQELKIILRRGRRDYDSVAGIVYAACYNDPYVLQKILTADPADVPSSGEEDAASSDEEYSTSEAEEDVVPENEDAAPAEASGSKEDPVVLDGSVEDGAGKSNPRKHKRTTSDLNNESSKKSKPSDTLVSCLDCGGKFNLNDNKEGSCRFHPEPTVLMELEDNPTNDDISDDEDSRETWPNAFQWECCETNFEEDEPCKTGKHRADDGKKTEYARRREKERRDRRYFG